MKARTLRATAVIVFLIFAIKSTTLWFANRAYAAYRNMELTSSGPATGEDAAERAGLLETAVRWSPHDADLWLARGRFWHRLSSSPDDWLRTAMGATLAGADPSEAALRSAVASYGRAAAQNALDAGSRFWRVIAEGEADRRAGLDVDPDDSNLRLDQLDRALALDPQRPDRWMDAGRFALSQAQPARARAYFTHALELSHDGLEDAVRMMLYSPEGIDGAVAVVPEHANAQERLAAFLFSHWRFAEADEAWRRYRRLAGLPIREDRPDVLVANGDFDGELGSSFHDWTVVPVAGAAVTQPGGGKGLSIDLDRGPANYFQVYQDVPVPAPGRYRLTGEANIKGFAAGTVLGLEAVHPLSPDLLSAGDVCYVSASPESGGRVCADTGATRFSLVFDVPDELPLIRIRPRRHGRDGESDSGRGTMIWKHIRLEPIPGESNESTTDAPGLDHHSNQE